MSERVFALCVGAFIGAGLGISLGTSSLTQCSDELDACRASVTCEQRQRGLAAYQQSLQVGLIHDLDSEVER